MKKPSITAVTPAKTAQDDLDTDALLTWLNDVAAAKIVQDKAEEEEPGSYASPPCYLAEFTDADGEVHPSK